MTPPKPSLEREFTIERRKRFKDSDVSEKEETQGYLKKLLNDSRFWIILTSTVGVLGFGFSLYYLIVEFPHVSLITQVGSFAIISVLTISWGWLAVATIYIVYLEYNTQEK
jgi:hypothetical protein